MSGMRWCDGLSCRVVTFDAGDPVCPGCGVVGHPIPTFDALPVGVRTFLAGHLRLPVAVEAGGW